MYHCAYPAHLLVKLYLEQLCDILFFYWMNDKIEKKNIKLDVHKTSNNVNKEALRGTPKKSPVTKCQW
jgi:hypothetical protein